MWEFLILWGKLFLLFTAVIGVIVALVGALGRHR